MLREPWFSVFFSLGSWVIVGVSRREVDTCVTQFAAVAQGACCTLACGHC